MPARPTGRSKVPSKLVETGSLFSASKYLPNILGRKARLAGVDCKPKSHSSPGELKDRIPLRRRPQRARRVAQAEATKLLESSGCSRAPDHGTSSVSAAGSCTGLLEQTASSAPAVGGNMFGNAPRPSCFATPTRANPWPTSAQSDPEEESPRKNVHWLLQNKLGEAPTPAFVTMFNAGSDAPLLALWPSELGGGGITFWTPARMPIFGTSSETTGRPEASKGKQPGREPSNGTRDIPFAITQEWEQTTMPLHPAPQQLNNFMSISAMPAYHAKCFEELRFEDYKMSAWRSDLEGRKSICTGWPRMASSGLSTHASQADSSSGLAAQPSPFGPPAEQPPFGNGKGNSNGNIASSQAALGQSNFGLSNVHPDTAETISSNEAHNAGNICVCYAPPDTPLFPFGLYDPERGIVVDVRPPAFASSIPGSGNCRKDAPATPISSASSTDGPFNVSLPVPASATSASKAALSSSLFIPPFHVPAPGTTSDISPATPAQPMPASFQSIRFGAVNPALVTPACSSTASDGASIPASGSPAWSSAFNSGAPIPPVPTFRPKQHISNMSNIDTKPLSPATPANGSALESGIPTSTPAAASLPFHGSLISHALTTASKARAGCHPLIFCTPDSAMSMPKVGKDLEWPASAPATAEPSSGRKSGSSGPTADLSTPAAAHPVIFGAPVPALSVPAVSNESASVAPTAASPLLANGQAVRFGSPAPTTAAPATVTSPFGGTYKTWPCTTASRPYFFTRHCSCSHMTEEASDGNLLSSQSQALPKGGSTAACQALKGKIWARSMESSVWVPGVAHQSQSTLL
ncbi:hypothetical protein WJX74_000615 [Apatococcus lobatus]|uniref:Uncharacterized protein n=1 Tax=Apatococcus lobatus TaxID=904363 RepID=A0AAW1RCV5_9CHLO